MPACTFFGHRDCPESVRQRLREVVGDLIENHDVDSFFIGNQGGFDRMAAEVLRELKAQHPAISYTVVLAYLPLNGDSCGMKDNADTLFPEGIETVPKRFAIDWRNKWMLRRSEYVVTYVTRSWGGAAKFEQLAKRQKKTVIPVGEAEM